VAVNVAVRQFKEGNMVELVDAALADSGLTPFKLELEMTESVLMSAPDTNDIISLLRERGVSISLDDFGTGYSSLSYLI
jgi:EAL domain-containing protein (putative c-di-GMP-specific phosphodiesterase class I)